MTVAVYVKVFDGIVLAADSATTLEIPLVGGGHLHQVYNNADKVFHLHRQLPVAGMTWGRGHIGPASISTLSKSLRLQLMGRDTNVEGIDIEGFTVEDVAKRVAKVFGQAAKDAGIDELGDKDELGYLVAGISTDCDQAEAWLLRFFGKNLEPEPEKVLAPEAYGFRAYAQPAAVNRLFNGYDDQLEELLITGVVSTGIDRKAAELQVELLLRNFRLDPVQPAMPLPDAIDLAKFMVETTEGYARYRLGPDTVGGPVEVASISPHEGFRWIRRKHYYRPELNPGEQP